MKCKRILAGALTAALLTGLLVLPAGAAERRGFVDIADPAVAEAAAVLQELGVVDGVGGGYFQPAGTLTRAQFSKMAVDVMGKGELEPAQRSRTIFMDVGPRHWARGYVNLASNLTTAGELVLPGGEAAGDRLIMGVGNGNFQPDRAITFGEAVAILVRVLGYNTGDITLGAAWYDGYLAVARENGLSKGLDLGGKATITRAQAAILFHNLLFTAPKGSQRTYLEDRMGGSIVEGVTPLRADKELLLYGQEGQTQTCRRSDRDFPEALLGVRGQMLLDSKGSYLTLRPEKLDRVVRTAIDGAVNANYITVPDLGRVTVKPDTLVWRDGEPTTFEKVWMDLRRGQGVVLVYGRTGAPDYLYLTDGGTALQDQRTMVARTDPKGSNPFASLLNGAGNVSIFKNGAPAVVSDLRKYDVAYFDGTALRVSDTKLTGIYENVYPNPTAPSRITLMGQEFTVRPEAADDLMAFRPGDPLTLLLTDTGAVAGAVKPEEAESNVLGIVTFCEKKEKEAGKAEIMPFLDFPNAKGEPIVFKGDPHVSTTVAPKMVGKLVQVISKRVGDLTLKQVHNQIPGSLKVAERTLGGVPVSETVKLYDGVDMTKLERIEYRELTWKEIPKERITYVARNALGQISLIVFDDIGGNRYEYGRVEYTPGYQNSSPEDEDSMYDYRNPSIEVENARNKSEHLLTMLDFKTGDMIGYTISDKVHDDIKHGPMKRLGEYILLNAIEDVSRHDFDVQSWVVRANGQVIPLSDGVSCYNASTGTWFPAGLEGLEQARAYSDNLTVYFDHTPAQGGKVRVVVVR